MCKLSPSKKRAVIERDGRRCVKCESTFNLEVDHIVPILEGGDCEFDNLQTLCRKCHHHKTRCDIARKRSEMIKRIVKGKGIEERKSLWKRVFFWLR